MLIERAYKLYFWGSICLGAALAISVPIAIPMLVIKALAGRP